MLPTDIADAYELLGISPEARDEDINKAFRQRSLKVHPDRNPNNPEAAQKFHELKQAQELLLDPQRRTELDASLKRQREYTERYAKANAKRKEMLDALDERERASKKVRTMTAAEQQKEEERVEKLKEASRKMREGRRSTYSLTHEPPEGRPIEVPTDIPISVKYRLTARPELSDAQSLFRLFSQFGVVDPNLITLKLKPPKNKPDAPAKFATAVLVFKRIEDAFGVVGASGRKEKGLEGVEVSWLGNEPPFVTQLKAQGMLSGRENSGIDLPAGKPTSTQMKEANTSFLSRAADASYKGATSTSSFPDLGNPESQPTLSNPNASKSAATAFESVTLMRLRQAERDRLAREILEQEAKGEQ